MGSGFDYLNGTPCPTLFAVNRKMKWAGQERFFGVLVS